jgi:hypothetical protein
VVDSRVLQASITLVAACSVHNSFVVRKAIAILDGFANRAKIKGKMTIIFQAKGFLLIREVVELAMFDGFGDTFISYLIKDIRKIAHLCHL